MIGVVVLGAIIVGAVAVLRMDPWGKPSREPAESARRDPGDPAGIDPALIRYREIAAFAVELGQPRALAAGSDGWIYVAGDQSVHGLDAEGVLQIQIALEDAPRCLAVGPAEGPSPERLYVGMADHVEVFTFQSGREAKWETLPGEPLLTSVAVDQGDVFLADAGNRIVWRYDASGRRQGRIGEPDRDRNTGGFLITSPYFDLAVASDGLLRVVNPRALRIEAYTFQGDLESRWGESASGIEGFFGCCNPIHIAALDDGRLVTAEKGIARVKVYGPQGELLCVVAGPDRLTVPPADLATDRRGRVLILDPVSRSVRIFEHKDALSGADP